MPNAIEQIYNQLTQVFGGTNPNQFFCMLMPATTLDQKSYAYDTTGIKPALVAEAESRLVDQMFDITQVTGSSNGQRVSSQYIQALSVLVPNFDPMMPVLKNTLRDFLNTPVPDSTTVDGKPFSGTLQDYYFALYDVWINKKMAWDVEQEAEKEKLAVNPSTANEKYLEWYEGVAEGRLAEIDAAMGKVLSVFSPADMDVILGALAAGPGGEIEEATNTVKDLRLPSPSGGFIYPVDLIPDDWFLDLASDMNPVDLLQDPEFIGATITARRQALLASISQVQALLSQTPTKAAMKTAADALSTAQTNYTTAQNTLLNTYADNTATAAEIYLAKHGNNASVPSDDAGKKTALAELNSYAAKVSKARGKQPPKNGGATKKDGTAITPEDVQKILAGQKHLIDAQSGLLTSSQALADAGLNLAAAQAQTFGDLPVFLARLQSQLSDIQTMQSQLATSVAASANSVPPQLLIICDQTTQDAANKAATEAETTANASGKTLKDLIDGLTKAVGTTPKLQPLLDAANEAVTSSLKDIAAAVSAAAEKVDQSVKDAATKAATDAETTANTPGKTFQDLIDGLTKAVGTTPKLQPLLDAANAAEPSSLKVVAAAVSAVANNFVVGVPGATSSPSGTSNRFMDLQFSFTSSDMSSSSSSSTQFNQTSWGVDLFFGSASGSSSSASSVNTKNSLDQQTAIQIGLKAAKVNVSRGWFDPGVFKLTKSMSRLSTNPVSAGPLPRTKDSTSGDVDWNQSSTLDTMNQAILPCFPVAFVVAKDVSIRFQATSSSLAAVQSVVDQRSAVGGGFLCFSASSSSASHNNSSSLSSKTEGLVITINMLGPQILGWFLETTPVDESKVMTDTVETGDIDISVINFVSLLHNLRQMSK